MNFFKKFRKSNVAEVDNDNTETPSSSIGRSSNGFFRKFGPSVSSSSRAEDSSPTRNGYHESETKLFEEIPIDFSSKKHVKHSKLVEAVEYESVDMAVVSPAADGVVGHSLHASASNHFNLNNNYQLEPHVHTHESLEHIPQGTEKGDAMDDSKVNRLMALYAAIIRGEKSEVKKLLTAHPDLLEAPDNFGRTPLMYCVLADRLDCAKLLLKMKCNLDQVDKAGRSALHLAAHKASYKFLELLQGRGGDIEMKDNDGQTPLHLTTRNHHAVCLAFVLKHLSPGMVDVTDNQNRTALHWSAAFNNADYVKQLIKHNSNTDMPDAEGKTPLHWAANTRDPSAVATLKAILDHSSSVLNWQDYDGRTALHFAVAHENVAAVEYLLKFEQEPCEVDRLDNSFRTPLHWAAQLGNTEIVRLLLSAEAKNSITDSNGATPLLYAALNNNSGVILEMIKHNSSVLEQADIEGRSALMWAAGKGANSVIKTLLKLIHFDNAIENSFDEATSELLKELSQAVSEKAKLKQAIDLNRTDNKGNTALHMAAWNGQAHSAELLLRNGANHDLHNNMNHTPLFGACEKGHVNVVKLLLEYSADINLKDHEERSPLHWAALGGHAEVCDLLIKKGLDPDLRDAYQRSPLHCAAFGGFINCMNLLLENGANVDLQDKEGLSALHWAAQSGHLDATKLLFQCSAFPNLMEFTEEHLTPLDHAMLNEREDVVQYLIEQGALSSEMIRDIAATRIQAYYRGCKVRKDLASRKWLFMKHNELRSKSKKKREERNIHNSQSVDHLNCVAEETLPAPKSPNADSAFADSVYSDNDERAEASEVLEANFPIRTIKSSLQTLTNLEMEHPNSDGSDSDNDRACNESHHAERNEDPTTQLNVPRAQITRHDRTSEQATAPSERLPVRSPSFVADLQSCASSDIEMLKLGDDGESANSVGARGVEDGSAADDQQTSGIRTSPEVLPPTPVDGAPCLARPPSTSSNASTCKAREADVEPERATRESSRVSKPPDSTDNADRTSSVEKSETESQYQPKKTKRKSKSAKRSSPASSKSSSRASLKAATPHSEGLLASDRDTMLPAASYSQREDNQLERPSSACPREESGDCARAHPPAVADAVNSTMSNDRAAASKSSEHLNKKHKKKKRQQEKKVAASRQAAIAPDLGDEDNIALDVVSGVAYKRDASDISSSSDDEAHDQPATKSFVASNDLSLSVYIESLMDLTPTERKFIARLQRNRKHAFKKAHAAALVIQTAWRRYIHRKYPHRTATKRKKKTKKQRHSTLHATPDAPKAVKSPDPSPTRKPGEPSRTSNVPMPSASVPRCGQIEPGGGAFEHDDTEPSSSRRDENKQTSLKLKPEKSCLPDPSPNNLSVKISGKKKRRPRATHGRRDSASSPTSESEGTEKCEAPGNSFETSASDPRASRESDHGKARRPRPKTEHSTRRHPHKLILPSDVENNCEKLEQLCKIYGQTLVLHDMYYPTERRAPSTAAGRFRTVPAPSARPRTSKHHHGKRNIDDEFEFVNPIDLRDPITAVQSFSPKEWKSSASKTRSRNNESPRRSKSKNSTGTTSSIGRKSGFSEKNITSMPLQWQQIHMDSKPSTLHRSGRVRPTRFSYNMRDTNS